MVHLPPAAIYHLKNTGCANVQVFYGVTIMVRPALSADCPKNVAGAMYGVVPKFNVNVRWTLEYCLVHFVRLICSTPNTSKRIVDCNLIRMSEIFVDHLQIPSVESMIELRKCLLRLAQISVILVTCNGCLDRFCRLVLRCTTGDSSQ